jgi:AcrR family transcriptional regulator
MNVVHTLNVVHSVPPTSPSTGASAGHLSVVSDDRRERARDKRRAMFLAAAGRVIDTEGLGGVTIKAVAEQADCAVGTIYTYFPSKAALIAALQAQAVETLRASLANAEPGWSAYGDESGLDEVTAVLVGLIAFSGFMTAASVVFADEFGLQRALLSQKVELTSRDETRDALAVVHRFVAPAVEMLDAAVQREVIEPANNIERVVVWITALNGVLLVDNLAALDRHLFRAPHLARMLTWDLLTGWGADRADVEVAASHVEKLAALGPMAPPPDGPGYA